MPNLRLTMLRPEHIDQVMTWINDPDVVRNFQNFDHRFTREEELRWIENINPERDMIFSVFTLDGAYVGQVSINQISRKNKLGRLGLFIKKEFRRKGYGTTAICKAIQYAFSVLSLRKVWLVVYGDNEKAQQLYSKIGFKAEGVLEEEYFWNGKWHNMVRMGFINPSRRGRVKEQKVV